MWAEEVGVWGEEVGVCVGRGGRCVCVWGEEVGVCGGEEVGVCVGRGGLTKDLEKDGCHRRSVGTQGHPCAAQSHGDI